LFHIYYLNQKKDKLKMSVSRLQRSPLSDSGNDERDDDEEEVQIQAPVPKKRGRKPTQAVEETVTFYIKEFDMNLISPSKPDDSNGTKLVVIGKANTGKSSLIADIVASKSHVIPVAQIFSGTEDSNHFYSTRFPGICVHNKLDFEALQNFALRQKYAKELLPQNPWAVQIIDDCTDDPSLLKKPLMQAYYKNGRHWKMLHILSLQYCMDIPPAIRNNVDFVFLLRESNAKTREVMHKNFAGIFPTLDEFNQVMDAVTEDYTALVIRITGTSNRLEDNVFYYKARDPRKVPPNWKFGHPSAWEFHKERMDPNYSDINNLG
jgi:hypothetical protein